MPLSALFAKIPSEDFKLQLAAKNYKDNKDNFLSTMDYAVLENSLNVYNEIYNTSHTMSDLVTKPTIHSTNIFLPLSDKKFNIQKMDSLYTKARTHINTLVTENLKKVYENEKVPNFFIEDLYFDFNKEKPGFNFKVSPKEEEGFTKYIMPSAPSSQSELLKNLQDFTKLATNLPLSAQPSSGRFSRTGEGMIANLKVYQAAQNLPFEFKELYGMHLNKNLFAK